jgi:hypothetical protein
MNQIESAGCSFVIAGAAAAACSPIRSLRSPAASVQNQKAFPPPRASQCRRGRSDLWHRQRALHTLLTGTDRTGRVAASRPVSRRSQSQSQQAASFASSSSITSPAAGLMIARLTNTLPLLDRPRPGISQRPCRARGGTERTRPP